MDSLHPRNLHAVELSVFDTLCEAVNSPYSLMCWIRRKHGDFGFISEELDVSRYCDAASLRGDLLIFSFLRKWKGWKTGKLPSQNATLAWEQAEASCLQTNRYLTALRTGQACSINRSAHEVFMTAKRKIADILGPFKLQSVLKDCRWGPGATVDLRSGTTPDQKHNGPWTVTRQALPYFKMVVETDPHWIELLTESIPCGEISLLPSNFTLVRHNRLVMVAKTFKTDRPISAEPTANSFLQQGVGRYIRRRLKKVGVDLDDQMINRERARRAFHDGLCTIDLSSASDTLSRELVFELLPIDWALYLDALRVTHTRLPDGREIYLQKFSGMGNAYTFELESLIFYALASSVSDDVTVYGDDIICPASSAQKVIDVLTDCGFKVNRDKSFVEGSFYESCGGQYFAGEDVTPVYQKDVVGPCQTIISAFNRLYRWSAGAWSHSLFPLFIRKWRRKRVPRIPEFCTDDRGFLARCSTIGPPDEHGTFHCVVLSVRPTVRAAISNFYLSAKLRWPELGCQSPEGNGELVSVPRSVSYFISKARISQFA